MLHVWDQARGQAGKRVDALRKAQRIIAVEAGDVVDPRGALRVAAVVLPLAVAMPVGKGRTGQKARPEGGGEGKLGQAFHVTSPFHKRLRRISGHK